MMRRAISGAPAVLLVVAFTAAGAEPAELAAVKKEDLRYDGKSFEHWRKCACTELKPERCIEALEALTVFGTNGYGEESAVVILEVTKRFLGRSWENGGTPEDAKVVESITAKLKEKAKSK